MSRSTNFKLFFLIFLYIVSFISSNEYVGYICIICIYSLILFSKILDSYLCSISTIPCMGVFDNIGINSFYNIAFILFLIRLIFYYLKSNSHIPIILLLLFVYINAYNIIVLILNDMISIDTINNSIGFFTATMVLSLTIEISEIKCAMRHAYYWMFTFILLSFLLGGIRDISMWGFPLPEAHRLSGLMRDPNYLSSFTAITIFSYFVIFDRLGITPFILTIVGLLTVSKMFLIIVIISYLYLIIVNLNKILHTIKSRMPIHKALFFIIIFFTTLLIIVLFSNYFFSKYFYRLTEYTLTTGRTFIWGQYLNEITNSMSGLFFGKSLSYSIVYEVKFGGTIMVVHNTFFDILLSFGLLNFILIIYAIYKYFTKIKYNKNDFVLIIILFIIMSSLSWLMIDNFFYLTLYIFLSICSNSSKKSIM